MIVNPNDLVFTATNTKDPVIPWSTLSDHPDIQQMVDRLVQVHLNEILQSDWFIDLVDQRILEAFELTNEEESAC